MTTPTIDDALRVAARTGLPVEPEVLELDVEIGDLAGRAGGADRLGGFFGAAVDAGELVVPEMLVPQIRRSWHAGLVESVGAEAAAVRVAGVLDEAGITWLISKGPALAHLDYPAPELRLFGDVDVVVHPNSWDAAAEALEGAGYRREFPELRPGFDASFGKGATFHDPAGSELDVHRRFAIGRFGLLPDMSEVFREPDEIILARRRIRVPNPTMRLVHAAFHASLGGFRRFRAFRDVAQLLLVTQADWRDAQQVASRWSCEIVLADAICETWRRLHLDVSHEANEWASAHRSTRRERSVLSVYQGPCEFRRTALTALPVLPRSSVPRYIAALALPSADARRSRRSLGSRSLRERVSATNLVRSLQRSGGGHG